MKIALRSVVLTAAACPLFAMIFCVAWSVAFNFASSTKTHCGVLNLLPSISAAIGDHRPQRYVWMMATGLSIVQRAVFGVIYFRLVTANKVALVAHLMENAGVFTLSFVTSTDNFAVHASGFVLFCVSAMVNMPLRYWAGRHFWSPLSRAVKRATLAVGAASLVAAGYFYRRHNALCEPYVYSLFAVCEYVFVVCNIVFHASLALDLPHHELRLAAGPRLSK